MLGRPGSRGRPDLKERYLAVCAIYHRAPNLCWTINEITPMFGKEERARGRVGPSLQQHESAQTKTTIIYSLGDFKKYGIYFEPQICLNTYFNKK